MLNAWTLAGRLGKLVDQATTVERTPRPRYRTAMPNSLIRAGSKVSGAEMPKSAMAYRDVARVKFKEVIRCRQLNLTERRIGRGAGGSRAAGLSRIGCVVGPLSRQIRAGPDAVGPPGGAESSKAAPNVFAERGAS